MSNDKHTSDNTLSVRREKKIELPSPEQESARVIDIKDWERIKKYIKKIPSESGFLKNVPSIAFGAGVTALFSIFSVSNEPTWIKPVTISFTIFAFLVFLLSHYYEKKQEKNKNDFLELLQEEISGIEKTFQADK